MADRSVAFGRDSVASFIIICDFGDDAASWGCHCNFRRHDGVPLFAVRFRNMCSRVGLWCSAKIQEISKPNKTTVSNTSYSYCSIYLYSVPYSITVRYSRKAQALARKHFETINHQL